MHPTEASKKNNSNKYQFNVWLKLELIARTRQTVLPT